MDVFLWYGVEVYTPWVNDLDEKRVKIYKIKKTEIGIKNKVDQDLYSILGKGSDIFFVKVCTMLNENNGKDEVDFPDLCIPRYQFNSRLDNLKNTSGDKSILLRSTRNFSWDGSVLNINVRARIL